MGIATAQKKNDDQNQGKVRVQFDFSKLSLSKLDETVDAIGASTRAEVIRRALTLFSEVLAAEQRGAAIILREKDGRERELLLLF